MHPSKDDVLAFMRKHDCAYEARISAGYEWRARGEKYGENAYLVIAQEGAGGMIGQLCGSYYYGAETTRLVDAWNAWCAEHNVHWEALTHWAMGLYRLDPATRQAIPDDSEPVLTRDVPQAELSRTRARVDVAYDMLLLALSNEPVMDSHVIGAWVGRLAVMWPGGLTSGERDDMIRRAVVAKGLLNRHMYKND